MIAFDRLKCWHSEPEKRPSIKQVGEELQLIWSELRGDDKKEEDTDGSSSNSSLEVEYSSAEYSLTPAPPVWKSLLRRRSSEYQLSPLADQQTLGD